MDLWDRGPAEFAWLGGSGPKAVEVADHTVIYRSEIERLKCMLAKRWSRVRFLMRLNLKTEIGIYSFPA